MAKGGGRSFVTVLFVFHRLFIISQLTESVRVCNPGTTSCTINSTRSWLEHSVILRVTWIFLHFSAYGTSALLSPEPRTTSAAFAWASGSSPASGLFLASLGNKAERPLVKYYRYLVEGESYLCILPIYLRNGYRQAHVIEFPTLNHSITVRMVSLTHASFESLLRHTINVARTPLFGRPDPKWASFYVFTTKTDVFSSLHQISSFRNDVVEFMAICLTVCHSPFVDVLLLTRSRLNLVLKLREMSK
jgi:hypothetical protein